MDAQLHKFVDRNVAATGRAHVADEIGCDAVNAQFEHLIERQIS